MEDGVFVCTTMSVFPYLDSTSALARVTSWLRYHLCIPSIRSTVNLSAFGEPDIIWSTIPGSSELKKLFPSSTFVFHVVDRYSAFRGDAVKALEKKDYEAADVDLVIGEALKNFLLNDLDIPSSKVVNIGQGVHLERFRIEQEKPAEYAKCSGPIAVWLGLLNKLDRPMLRTVVKQIGNLGGDVFIIGKKEGWINELEWDISNLHFIGSRNADEVAPFLVNADIGLMLYDRQKAEVYEGQHPLKLYEYAAAGLCVLSTYHKEFETLDPPVIQVNTEDEIIDFFRSYSDQLEKCKNEMLLFSEEHSWDKCADKALRAIDNLKL